MWQLCDVDESAKDQIERLRAAGGFRSNRQMAEAIGLVEDDIKNAIRGVSKKALDRVLDAMSAYMGGPMAADAGRVVGVIPSGMTKIHLIGSAAAGDGSDYVPDDDFVYIPSRMGTGIEFGFIVEGDSLMPYVQPGDVLIAKPELRPIYKHLMIVRRPDSTLSAKEVIWHEGKTMLRSADGRPDEVAEGSFVGLVTGMYRYSHGIEKAIQSIRGLRLEDF